MELKKFAADLNFGEQIEMTLALTSSYEGSNSGHAIKPKKPVKRQADTETRKFRFNVI